MEAQTTTRAEHTPGRLETDGTVIFSRPGNVLARTVNRNAAYGTVTKITSWDEQGANARRLAAAWNACEGIPTDELERGIVTDLLAACKLALADIYGVGGQTAPTQRVLQDVVARATGKAG